MGLLEYIQSSKLDEKDVDTYFMAEAVTIETTAILEHALGKLPNKEAQIVRLSLKDFTNKEITKELNISVNTVENHKKVAYQKLRGYFNVLRNV